MIRRGSQAMAAISLPATTIFGRVAVMSDVSTVLPQGAGYGVGEFGSLFRVAKYC